jgi:hypothetical protein
MLCGGITDIDITSRVGWWEFEDENIENYILFIDYH